MTLEEPGPREALATDVALAGQGVGPDVHLEGGEGGVALGAVFAAEALLDLVGAVELLVLGVARLGREGLLALQAVERLS